ncbi:helicase-exonuclease AddAB subunit AddA [Emergencia timonensis]
MNWTREQQRAIDEREKNILVAAAAGSGKTAVLVERIKKLVIEDGVSIDRMLIVAFTNAAAAEMKEKIRVAINQEIDADPANSQNLRQQLNLLPRANISTFHAFALDVIRTFFFLTDIEPGFAICDDAQRTIIKEDSMDQLMEQCFASDAKEFYDFLNWYSSDRNQNKIRDIINTSYNVLQSLPYPWQWLKEKIEELSLPPEAFLLSPVMNYIWDYIGDAVEKAVQFEERAVEELSAAGLSRLAEKTASEELCFYQQMAEAAARKDLTDLSNCIAAFKAVRLVAKKEEKEAYAQVKDLAAACRKKASGLINDIKGLFFTQSLEEMVSEMNETAPKAETLRKLLEDFDQIFKANKADKKLVDFNDIEHYCLSILEETQAQDHYRKKFEYIFIDEYQDTNILQEEIIAKVARNNNLFMVGDMKQSIYKFRLAEPEIFKRKYLSYGSAENEQSTKIDLNQNFRSKPLILSEINHIFENLMEDYDEDAMLYPGVSYDGPYHYVPEVKVVDTSTIDDADEELANLKNAEIEALEICRLIKENLGRKFFDHKAGIEREIRLHDMVILMRGVRNYADVYRSILKENGVDSFVDDSEGYFDTMEINVFMNLLSVIDNKMQDVPLISVLHSEIFSFSTDELGQIRAACKNGQYAAAFLKFAKEGKLEPLREKCRVALDSIKKWKTMATSQPLGQFIWKLLLETGYYLEMGAMPGGTQRQANLRALVDKAEKFAADRQSSLYSFVRYIDAVKRRGVPMGQVKLVGENDDLVRIMTIHKSKGLEFPLVIVCGMGRRLNYTKIGSGIALHKDIGIGMTLTDFEGHWYKQTLLQRLIQKQIHKEEVSEEIRVLYVALTRAKDLLYLTGTVRDGAKFMESRQIGLGGDTMYLDMIGDVSRFELVDANRLSPDSVEKSGIEGNPMGKDIFDRRLTPEEEAEVLRRLNFNYPYESSRKLKSKYSVTEVYRMGLSDQREFETVLAVPKFRQGERRLTAAEKGTIYHSIMERLDFDRAEREGMPYIEEAAADYANREIFQTEDLKAIELSHIADFFTSELGHRCASAYRAGRLDRERPFDLQMEMEGETVIVQGIIDCYFEEGDGFVLLDYKTNWIDENKDFDQEAKRLRRTYRGQIEIYRQALEASKGRPVKEACLYLFGSGKLVEM